MSVIQSVRDDIFAEPSGRSLNWLTVAWGLFVLGIVLAGVSDFSIGFALVGAGFVFMGGAKLVPSGRRFAGVLRICSMTAFGIYGIRVLIRILG